MLNFVYMRVKIFNFWCRVVATVAGLPLLSELRFLYHRCPFLSATIKQVLGKKELVAERNFGSEAI